VGAIAKNLGVLFIFVASTVALRGSTIAEWSMLNPDEAELMAQARAAMQSPLPFSTWTSGTTGPFWVQFLALLGALGFPLTLAFAHLLSAVMVGTLAFLTFVLARRNFGAVAGLGLAALMWLPLALISPVGVAGDFGALSTELLPSLWLFCAALIRSEWVLARPWLIACAGLLSGLAVGSKYQVVPLVGALLVAQLVALKMPVRELLPYVLKWAIGAVAPFAFLGVAMLLSRGTSWDLLRQNIAFLGSYSGGVSTPDRLAGTLGLIYSQAWIFIQLIVVVWLSRFSRNLVLASRVLLVLAGVAALYGGGKGFGHYLIFMYAAVALAAVLPAERVTSGFPLTSRADRLAGLVVALMVASFILPPGNASLTPLSSVKASLSASSVHRSPALATACPAGSRVLVWGWASEMYVNYSWENTVPFMNVLGLTTDDVSRARGLPYVERALAQSDCIVDAVEAPFFGFGAGTSLATVYPALVPTLERDYRKVDDLIDCAACTIYVRD